MTFILGMCLSAALIYLGYRLKTAPPDKTKKPHNFLNLSDREYRNFLNYDGSEQE